MKFVLFPKIGNIPHQKLDGTDYFLADAAQVILSQPEITNLLAGYLFLFIPTYKE